nr:hypothetical protein [Sporichthyaceae bacterium]
MRTMKRPVAALGAALLIAGTLVAGASSAGAHAQHGTDEGHLLDPQTAQPDTDGDGDWGKVEF